MGQRLVINIHNGKDNILANAYYHWSGYTTDASILIRDIIKNYSSIPESFNDLQRAVAMLVITEAGIDAETMLNNDVCTFPECISRNEGIIATSEEKINESLDWAEEIVDINLEDLSIEFSVFFERPLENEDDIEELKAEMGDDFNIDEHCEDLPPELTTDGSIITCNFNNFHLLLETIEKARAHDNFIRYKDEFGNYKYLQLIY